MSTSTLSKLDTLTVAECKAVIDSTLESFKESLTFTNEEIEVITYSVLNNIQLRDYLLGAPYDHDLDKCASYIYDVIAHAKSLELETYPLETILAQFKYEQGDSASAVIHLLAGTSRKYSLARLLSRVMVSGANPAIFEAMRKELHPKVVKNLIEDSNELANEENR
jgi:hypothetical protein